MSFHDISSNINVFCFENMICVKEMVQITLYCTLVMLVLHCTLHYSCGQERQWNAQSCELFLFPVEYPVFHWVSVWSTAAGRTGEDDGLGGVGWWVMRNSNLGFGQIIFQAYESQYSWWSRWARILGRPVSPERLGAQDTAAVCLVCPQPPPLPPHPLPWSPLQAHLISGVWQGGAD